MQDTQPLPAIKLVYVYDSGLLTVRQVRERCGLNHVQLAKLADVRPIVVDWFERDVNVRREEAARLLNALAGCIRERRQNTLFDMWKSEPR